MIRASVSIFCDSLWFSSQFHFLCSSYRRKNHHFFSHLCRYFWTYLWLDPLRTHICFWTNHGGRRNHSTDWLGPVAASLWPGCCSWLLLPLKALKGSLSLVRPSQTFPPWTDQVCKAEGGSLMGEEWSRCWQRGNENPLCDHLISGHVRAGYFTFLQFLRRRNFHFTGDETSYRELGLLLAITPPGSQGSASRVHWGLWSSHSLPPLFVRVVETIDDRWSRPWQGFPGDSSLAFTKGILLVFPL